ncbi:hypothetical protein F2Q70_00036358 [Brassica cretica]|uniref:Uncharacterized protein n=2 Tax=Brassica cretica TaxID=69181 RepID=A0A8S9JVD3_BRACR|nr:hypothetical protein F2Q68_00031553 [Brassica cretica]KAF2586490.1 hypothetical protein F2Q70_00036358 [Brassica cretica]
MRLLENDDHIWLIGLKEKTSFYLQIGIRWKVATLEMQMNLNQGKLKSENRNMIFQSLLLERVVRYLLLKPNLCGMNSNASKAEWIETHKCIIGEQQEEIQSTKKLEKPQEHKLMEKPFQRELMKILSP